MKAFEVTAEITCYPADNGCKSKKVVFADSPGEAKKKFYTAITGLGNIDKKYYNVIDIRKLNY